MLTFLSWKMAPQTIFEFFKMFVRHSLMFRIRYRQCGLFLAYRQSRSTGFDKLLTPAIQRRLSDPSLSTKLHRTFLLRLQPDYLLSTFPISVARSSRHLSSYSSFVTLITLISLFHNFESKIDNPFDCVMTCFKCIFIWRKLTTKKYK